MFFCLHAMGDPQPPYGDHLPNCLQIATTMSLEVSMNGKPLAHRSPLGEHAMKKLIFIFLLQNM